MADLTALDQEYADFEELHVLEEKLISASSRTNLPESPGRGAGSRSLADLFGQQQQQGKEKEKAGSGDDEEEGIYSMLSPRKYAKRPSVINQKEFEELRLQVRARIIEDFNFINSKACALLHTAPGSGKEAKQDLGDEAHIAAAQHAGAEGFLHQGRDESHPPANQANLIPWRGAK
jgi:hypothetical protein